MPEATGVSTIRGSVPNIPCNRFSDEGWARIAVSVPDETDVTIYVNQQELVTVMCTPSKLNCLVLGFLYTEGIISGMDDVASMRVCDDESEVDVRLMNSEYKLPTLRTLTSGCGGGAAFKTEAQKVESGLVVTPANIFSLMKQFQEQMALYRLCGGVHASALCDTSELLVVSEDIGRHNTLDKIQGECLLRGISTRDRLLLSTGRVSSEMLLKAARMQTPVVVSRTSPTGRAVSLAHDLGIALVGYVRGNRLSVYSHPERLGCSI
ncbi:MAG: formate dehydrogenase accessory sulfurtransferase FdhD [Chloroflexi bacterium]|nr:formate dehydrogenase accessory sulfurtransferase FdhD [Chloroflexota bacterium]